MSAHRMSARERYKDALCTCGRRLDDHDERGHVWGAAMGNTPVRLCSDALEALAKLLETELDAAYAAVGSAWVRGRTLAAAIAAKHSMLERLGNDAADDARELRAALRTLVREYVREVTAGDGVHEEFAAEFERIRELADG